MFKKIFLWLFFGFILISPVYSYDFKAGECDYLVSGMACYASGCSSGERCTWNRQFKEGDTDVYVGTCKKLDNLPCTSSTIQLCSKQGLTLPEPKCGESLCPTGSVCEYRYGSENNPFSGNPVVYCSPETGSNCFAFNSTGDDVNYIGVCVDKTDTLCSNPNICSSDSDCSDKDPYTSCKSLPGASYKVCMTPDSVCTMPDYVKNGDGIICSSGTGCDGNDSYCSKDFSGISLGKESCGKIDFTNSVPSTCFADTNKACGIGVPNLVDGVVDVSYPLNVFCKGTESCLNINTFYSTNSKSSSYIPYAETNGKVLTLCKQCAASEDSCTEGIDNGISYFGESLDNCCDPDKRCVAGKCQTLKSISKCTRNPDYPAAGGICANGQVDVCDKCPIQDNGQIFVTNADGTKSCLSETASSIPLNECACAAGENFNLGECTTECIAPNKACSLSGKECCQPNSNTSYSCSDTSFTCTDPTCEKIKQGQDLSCSGYENCCPSGSTCDSKTKKCTATSSLNCSADATGCCAVGKKCQNGSCSGDAPECELIPTPASEAPEYTGPAITIKGLVSSIVGILFPLAIGFGLFYTTYWGYQMMVSEGSPDKVKAAQEGLSSAVIGLVFVVLATSIIRLIVNTILGG